ncbi:MAG TPA: cytochrome c maturation protein CcmE [Stellaceae bacterium]|nr:cytochrome c maturation protein CcmE [Stellaceae bacterium]
MTRKSRRLIALLAGLVMLGVATGLVLSAFNEDLVYFYSPSEALAKHPPPGRVLRLGGLVEPGSVARFDQGKRVEFRVADGTRAVPVTYRGALPDLFREGQGVVVEGSFDKEGILQASEVLAKHDERYMPPEVAATLKKNGQWKGSP